MSRGYRYRRGHDLENVYHRFTDDDLADLKPKKLFMKKWIILKKVEKRGNAHCYQVCDKGCKIFGILHLEIGEDNITSIPSQVEFSLQQFSQGYSHRFTTVIDSNIINNHVFYMVTRIRAGPRIDQLLNCLKEERMTPLTASFMAIDILTVMELLNSSGHVLRNWDARQWKMDARTRTFYLDDTSDITVSSDKRNRSIDEIHILNAETLHLHWTSQDLSYAPVSYIINGPMHRMSELDMFETFIYVIYEWVRGKLPWKNSKSEQRTLEMKKEFLEHVPDVMEEFTGDPDHWFNTAIHNLGDHLKLARQAEERFEKMSVRGGAWCPNGPRAGALLSIVIQISNQTSGQTDTPLFFQINYRRIIEDFHKIVCNGKPEWSMYWRDAKLDWESDEPLTPSQKRFLEKYENRLKSQEIADEWQRLRATRAHYTVMEEHARMEREKNQIAIDRYLRGDPDDETVKKETEERFEEWREKRRRLREEMWKERYPDEPEVMAIEKKEIKEELEEEGKRGFEDIWTSGYLEIQTTIRTSSHL
ncbi:hypothetical protein CAEBREN_06798 [Caenorhabditis brenneri]|uniref:Protein kinase domain-containing protein n=1 Tax=Caenorhabditis brenneri TaxID=135651 RepID=G0NQD0_CAEBE|nr:hypothetical protein CAEBREN_06798 [Caenorhabditis brenneri]